MPFEYGLEMGLFKPGWFPMEGEATTDEETERLGTAGPCKGAGWWGLSPPLMPPKKGARREFADSA